MERAAPDAPVEFMGEENPGGRTILHRHEMKGHVPSLSYSQHVHQPIGVPPLQKASLLETAGPVGWPCWYSARENEAPTDGLEGGKMPLSSCHSSHLHQFHQCVLE